MEETYTQQLERARLEAAQEYREEIRKLMQAGVVDDEEEAA